MGRLVPERAATICFSKWLAPFQSSWVTSVEFVSASPLTTKPLGFVVLSRTSHCFLTTLALGGKCRGAAIELKEIEGNSYCNWNFPTSVRELLAYPPPTSSSQVSFYQFFKVTNLQSSQMISGTICLTSVPLIYCYTADWPQTRRLKRQFIITS